LRITGIALTPSAPARGGVFDAKVTVKNAGFGAASNVLVSVWANKAEIATNSAGADLGSRVSVIAPDASIVHVFRGLKAGAASVKRIFRAFADSDLSLDEILESNNQMTLAYTPVSRPDFIITDILLDPKNPPAGSSFGAKVTVKNTGYVAGDAGYVDVWVDKGINVLPGPYLKGDKYQLVGVLSTNAVKPLTFTGLTAGTNPVAKVFRAVVESRGKTAEIVETNNQLTVDYKVVP